MKNKPTANLVASLCIVKGNKALILREPKDDGQLYYNIPGGHIEAGEGILDGARREAVEETGFKIAIISLLQIINSSWKNGRHSVRQTFLAKVVSGKLRTENGSVATWMTGGEIDKLPNDQFNFGVKEALALAFKGSSIDNSAVIIRDKGQRQVLK